MINLKYLFLGLMMIFLLCFVLLMLSYSLSSDMPDSEKLSPYECGFSPFSDNSMEFDVKFFLVGILFIMFDLELSFLFPWSLTINNMNYLGILSMLTFIYILTVGLMYEWLSGGLDWY